jgi:hypothetical protein
LADERQRTTEPAGEAVAERDATRQSPGAGEPYTAIYYKILTRQGHTAPGGAVDYIVNGNMIGGFAAVPIRPNTAIPAS